MQESAGDNMRSVQQMPTQHVPNANARKYDTGYGGGGGMDAFGPTMPIRDLNPYNSGYA